MDAPLIVTNVEFSEVKRGYDPEEVDNYLRGVDERLAQVHEMLRGAVERAEAAEAKLAEAMRAKATADQAAAEAQARANEAERKAAESAGGDDGTDALKKMLMLAQRTADSAVEEAQASAKNIVADARSKSAEIVADAENRSERILVEAQKVADELRQERTAAIAEEVDTLQTRKADLVSDIDVLETHLEDHRVRLRSGIEGLEALLAGDLRVDERPVVHTDPTPSPAAPAAAAGGSPTPVAVGPSEPAPSTSRPSDPATAAKVGDLQEAPAPKAPKAEATPPEAAAPAPVAEPAPAPAEAAPAPAEPAPAPVVTREELEGGGPPTQPITAVDASTAVPIVSGENPPKGDDEAMRRFFEDDLEVSDEKKGGLFRKK